jgi:diphosphomevalonate decarboxylase
MSNFTATAVACANIAFIKYWGNRDETLRLPVNPSLSMNLDGLYVRTEVSFAANLAQDTFSLNGQPQSGAALERVSKFMDVIRERSGIYWRAAVTSHSNFPIGAGIASSAAAFAALALAGSRAAGLDLGEADLSRLARLGSGSAARSIPGGFVEWKMGSADCDSYAFSIAPADHWALADCIAVISGGQKPVGSTEGHALAGTSPLQAARVEDAPRRLNICRQAILARDFPAFAEIVELDSTMMHAVMMTSQPALFYWDPVSLEIMKRVPAWRVSGLPCCFTLDAGPNVHVICPSDRSADVQVQLSAIPGVQRVLVAQAGGPARIIEQD